MRTVECPKCGADISENYEAYDPDCGFMRAGWFCDVCDEFVDDDDTGPEDY